MISISLFIFKREMFSSIFEELSQAILAGDSVDLKPRVREILDNEKVNDVERMAMFKVLPRYLTCDSIRSFLQAEKNVQATTVSQLLIQTQFEGVKPADRLAVLKHVAQTLAHDDSFGEAVFNCNMEIVASGEKGVEGHALAAIVYGINTPSFLLFEDLLEVLTSNKSVMENAQMKQLIPFIQEVLVNGSVDGLDTFLKKVKNEKYFESIGATGIRRKCQLLSVVMLLSGKNVVSFKELGATLHTDSEEEIQTAVMNASLAGVVTVRVDQKEKVVHVFGAVPLKFDRAAWEQLQERLNVWTRHLQDPSQ